MSFHCTLMNASEQLLALLQAGQSMVVNPRRRNGIILVKPYHAEFAGPGAFVGGELDQAAIACYGVGNLSWLTTPGDDQLLKAYLIRRQWTVLIKQIVDNPIAKERAQVILNQLEHWFDRPTVARLPDEALGTLVGVMAVTIKAARTELNLIP